MIRISDARMSGTAYGTVILHTSPEAAVNGPLAAVQNGDEIKVDVENNTMQLLVDNKVFDERVLSEFRTLPYIQRSVIFVDVCSVISLSSAPCCTPVVVSGGCEILGLRDFLSTTQIIKS